MRQTDLFDIRHRLDCASRLAMTLSDALEHGKTASPFYADAAQGIAILIDYIQNDVGLLEEDLPCQTIQEAP